MIFERSQKALCEKMKGDTEMKRVLSLVLSALLIVSMLMTGAMAETMEVEQTLHLVRFASNNYNTCLLYTSVFDVPSGYFLLLIVALTENISLAKRNLCSSNSMKQQAITQYRRSR